jgi:hypothetical protein
LPDNRRRPFKSDDAIDRTRGSGEHDHRHRTGLLQVANDRKSVLLRHVKIEHDQIRPLIGQLAPKARAAVAERDLEAMHAEIVADHLAGGGLVINDKSPG